MFVHIGNGENILMLSKEMKNIYYRMYTIQSSICCPNSLLPSGTQRSCYKISSFDTLVYHTSTKYLFVHVRDGARSKNLRGIICPPPPVEIGLTDLPKSVWGGGGRRFRHPCMCVS
jgi:hypothetical protein